MEDAAAPPDVVTGEVIKRSLLKTAGLILVLILFFIFALFLVWVWCVTTLSNATAGTLCTATAAILLGAPILAVSLIHRLLVRERLVIGNDRLQIIRRFRGRDVVCLQIPFVNITECTYDATDPKRRLGIGIDLADLDDSATYLKGEDLKVNKELKGWHYVLEGGYQTDLVAIHKMLVERMGSRSLEGGTLLPKDQDARRTERMFSSIGDLMRWPLYGLIFCAIVMLLVAGLAILMSD